MSIPLVVARARWVRPALLGAGWLAGAGCGGNVVVDGAGMTTAASTGSSSSSSSSSSASSSASSSTGGVECSGTYAQLANAVRLAQMCDPVLVATQCSGVVEVHDACGCMLIANEASPGGVDQANAQWAACVAMGCCGPAAHPISPPGCAPCGPTPSSGTCNAMTNLCEPLQLGG